MYVCMAISVCNVSVATILYMNGVSNGCIHTHILTSFLLKYNLVSSCVWKYTGQMWYWKWLWYHILRSLILRSDNDIAILPQHCLPEYVVFTYSSWAILQATVVPTNLKHSGMEGTEERKQELFLLRLDD